MVNQRAIEVNPRKIRALKEIKSSQKLKEVPNLIGRVVVLSRFVFKVTDKCLPFFEVRREKSTSGRTFAHFVF